MFATNIRIILSMLAKLLKFRFSAVVMAMGLFFLYIPLISVVIFSFNKSPLSSAWHGFSIKWYIELLKDELILESLWNSLKIAFYTANMSVFLGLLTAIGLQRLKLGAFFKGMVLAPLVLPDVIAGVSLLLLFISMAETLGWPSERGIATVWIAHSTIATAYVTVLISTRLSSLNPQLEEAALDLGATPLKIFFYITVPQILPSLLSGWLLGFTLSLDDLVLASFISGPEVTTLTMVVFSAARFGSSPKINALSSLIILFISIVAWISWYKTRNNKVI